MSSYLIRARMRQSPDIATLGRVLLPNNRDARVSAEHHLVWSLFAGNSEKKRDFLWRSEAPGQFLILAPEVPTNSSLFDIEAKEFAPELEPGDLLGFTLRANPTIDYKVTRGDKRGRRADVVMHALHAVPRKSRAEARPDAILKAGREWLTRQGEHKGFKLVDEPEIDGYDTRRLERPAGERGGRSRPITFGLMDLNGVLEVQDPKVFLDALHRGFGRARAFGCGLMLIRRV